MSAERSRAAIRRLRLRASAALCLAFAAGCVTERTVDIDSDTPSVRVRADGVYFENRRASDAEIVDILESAGVPHERSIHILAEGDLSDLRDARRLMATLARAGYRRPILVTKRHASSGMVDPARKAQAQARGAAPARKPIRYKGANE